MKNLLVIERNPVELERAREFFQSIPGVNFLTSNILNKKRLYGLGDIQLERHIHDIPLHGIITDIYWNPKIIQTIKDLMPQIGQPNFAHTLLDKNAGRTLFAEVGLRYMINAYLLDTTPLVCCMSGFSTRLKLDFVHGFSEVLGSVLKAPDEVGIFQEKNWRYIYAFFEGLWSVQSMFETRDLN